MKIKNPLLLTVLLPLVCLSAINKDKLNLIKNCKSAQQCVSIISKIAEPSEHNYDRISETEYVLVEKLLKFQPEVIDLIIPILLDENKDKAQLAARTLRDVKTIDKKYFGIIKKGLDRGFGWLPPALGRINSFEACEEAVHRYLMSSSSPSNQESYALKLCEKKLFQQF